MERRKLPVFRTVGRAYGFFFTKFFCIVRVGWFGILFLSLLMLGGIYYKANPQLASSAIWVGSFFVVQIAGAIISIVVLVGLFRVYFGFPRELGVIYFKIDRAFWRFVVAYALQYIFFVLLAVLFVLVELWAARVISGVAPTLLLKGAMAYGQALSVPARVAMSAGLLFFLAVYVFVSIRLQLFYPIIVAEKRLGLVRSWNLTRKNVWRLIGSSIVLMLSIALSFILILMVIYLLLQSFGVEIKSGIFISINLGTFVSVNLKNSSMNLMSREVSFLILQLYLFSVIVGFSSAAYDALKPEKELPDPVDTDKLASA